MTSWKNKLVRGIYNSPAKGPALALYDFLIPEQEKTVEINGSKFIINNKRPYERGLQFGLLEPEIHSKVMDLLEPGDIFVDVGAWIGDYTIPAVRRVGDSGKVISFEPDPRNFTRLTENIEVNSLENVQVINRAVASKTGSERFSSVNDGGPMSRVHDDGDLEIEATTLDRELADIEKVKVVKIDVEGLEEDVLEGSRSVLDRINYLVVEFHPKRAEEKNIDDFLDEHGFDFSKIRRKGTDQFWYFGENYV